MNQASVPCGELVVGQNHQLRQKRQFLYFNHENDQPTMKTLIVKPLGGLANRMRVIEAAYNFAQNHSSALIILWEKNNILNASFFKCFEELPKVKIFELNCSGKSIFSKFKRLFVGNLERLYIRFTTNKRLQEESIEKVLIADHRANKGQLFFDALASQHKNVYLETCFEFYPNISSLDIAIQNEIQAKAKHILMDYHYVIGVHIRRTDNNLAIEQSPLELYKKQMDEELKRVPEVRFYLSTDCDEVLETLKASYKERIITGVSVRRRDTEEGIIAALTDMCCLSQCKKIFGSSFSTFSERAARIGKIPLKILRKTDSVPS